MKTLRSIAVLAAAVGLASCLFQLEYNVGGTVTGLKGTGLVLQDNSRDDLRVNANGAFTFSSRVAKGNTYAVTVKTQPSNPAQTCTVQGGSGTMAKVNITGVVLSCSQAGRYAYVANQTANTISAFSINSTNGLLTPVPGSQFASTGAAPVALVVDPNGGFLYVANNASNTVGIFAINNTTGALTVTDFSVLVGSSPAALCVDPSGRYLYVANSGSNTVSAFAIQNGFATPVGSPVAAGNQPVALQTDPGGNFLYVTDFADGNVTVLAIDSTTGSLSGVSGSPFGGGSGAGAVSIAVDPVGSFAYVANRTAATITAYSIDPTTGALAASGSPLATTSAPQSITVGPAAANFVYAANVTSSNYVASYAIGSSNGALTLSSTAIARSLPVAVAVDPSGQFVYAANQNSGNVSVFTVDAATGALTEVTGSPFLAGGGARSIAID
jgi:6-phosphogluconolactonase